jgi:hypothetical protein
LIRQQPRRYDIGLDVHKKMISYSVKDASGQVHQEGQIGSTRWELEAWIKTLPHPRRVAMEATIFTGWIYDHLLPHAEQVKVAQPPAKKKRFALEGPTLLLVMCPQCCRAYATASGWMCPR